MKSSTNNRTLFALAGLLAIWVLISTIAIGMVDQSPDTVYLAFALLAFTVTMAVTDLFIFSGWLAFLVSIGLYTAVTLVLRTADWRLAIPIGVCFVAFLGTALFGRLVAGQIKHLHQQIEHDQKIIDDLRVKDPLMGLVRWTYARQTLRTEVQRCQRYHSALSLIMAKVDGLEELEKEQGEAFVQEIKKQIGIILVNSLREMDIPFGDGNFGIILPQTTEEGAVVAARRIADSVNRKVRVALYIGVASFGSDALNDDELQKVAEAALNVAQTTNKTVVCYSQIRNATERTQSSVDVAL